MKRSAIWILMTIGLAGLPAMALSWQYIWRNQGDARDVHFGSSVLGVGDWNHDGFDDVLIGSAYPRIELFYGGNPMDTLPDWSISGTLIGSAGDLNHDGIMDFIVTKDQYYIFYGGNPPGFETRDTLPNLTLAHYAPNIITRAGDVNGDGYDDLFLWCNQSPEGGDNRGYLRLLLGSENGLDTTNVAWEIAGQHDMDQLGGSTVTGFDYNGDGRDDFIINSNGRPNYEELYFGDRNCQFRLAHHWVLDNGQFPSPVIVDSCEVRGITPIEDMNGDGKDELLLHLLPIDRNPDTESFAAIMFGHAELDSFQADVILNSDGIPASLGDINGDGYNDLLLGYYGAFGGLGEVTIYLGGRWMNGHAILEQDAWNVDWLFTRTGERVAWCGDVNGDGLNDIMFGSVLSSGRESAGQICIIGGGREWRTGIDDDFSPPFPSSLLVNPAYPDPANGALEVDFNLPQAGTVGVNLLDLNGRSYLTQSASYSAGQHNYRLDASGLASGRYYLTLRFGGETRATPVVILK